jgi:D-2-hydroxyacid dehydrogenase (NADP+)
MNILHDFNLGLKHFTIPENLLNEIKLYGFNIKDYINASENDKHNCQIFFGNRITTSDLVQMPKLEYIHLGCVGYNNLDTEVLKRKKIKLTNSSGIVERSMAETTLAAILWFNKSFNFLNNTQNFSREFFDDYYDNFIPISKSKLLIFGYGKVSCELIKLVGKLTKNITVVVRNTKNCSYSGKILSPLSVSKNINEYNYIINCLPLNSMSKNYFDKDVFKKMNSKSIYINIGRSGTTVFNDLLHFVKKNKIRGAYLDVYEINDIINNQIIKDDRFLISPHISGWTNEYWEKQFKLFTNNLNCYKSGNYNELLNKII